MAKAPKTTPDRHYSFRFMNAVFAWSALGLLAVTLWMVFADYAKPWKRLQAQFREREREMVLAEAEAERESLDQNEIAQIQEDIRREEESLAGQREEIRALEKQLSALGKKVYAADAAARTTKSVLDTARYQLDVAMQEDNAARQQKAREEVEELERRLREERKELEAYTEERKGVESALEEKRSSLEAAEERLAALKGGLEALERRVANLDKKIDYFVLNAPLMDFVEPNLKIEQVILSGLYQDINFTNVDRVDRCMTCHVAANRAGFDGEEWEEPLRSHPRLDLYLSANSPHPYSRFGCTACHGGLDRATDFARAGHSPESEEERRRWVEEWGWKPQKYLDTPILPAKYSEAGCISCHAGNLWTPQSELQDTGREIMMHTGCYVCHQIDYPAFETLPRLGPDLARVASKVEPEWAFKFISAPREFRPTSWMPHFFFQPNTTTAENLERQKAEILAAIAYLWEHSRRPEYQAAPPGDPDRGKELFEGVGCTGCHILEAEATRADYYPQINRLHGPNLVRTGSKLTSGWLYAWLKNPKEYAPDTRMPSLRLTDREAADITAYLMTQRDPAFENLTLPEADPGVRDQLVLSYLQNNLTIAQSQARLESMSPRERDVYLGEETIQKYGCWGCHALKGFEAAKPIGVEISEHGSKPVHQFDFGHVHEVPHTRHDWIKTKMLEPRIWDRGKEAVKSYGELYRMPDFGLSEIEAEAILVNVLGFTKESVLDSRKADQGRQAAALAAGRRLVSLYNCQACHLIEGAGQAIRTAVEDVDQLPPNLASEGARVQSEWLFGYLHDPGKVRLRPWLSARMPTFGFSDEQINTLIAYFAALDDREPFLSEPRRPGERSLGVGRITFNMLQCAKCHPAGPQAVLAPGAQPGELAPSLLLARERLRHDWVPAWIKDPQSWIEGTKMPANFPRMQDGSYQSPLAAAIGAPMFTAQKQQMMAHFDSEDELKAFLADTDKVTVALRDHIWWNLPD